MMDLLDKPTLSMFLQKTKQGLLHLQVRLVLIKSQVVLVVTPLKVVQKMMF